MNFVKAIFILVTFAASNSFSQGAASKGGKSVAKTTAVLQGSKSGKSNARTSPDINTAKSTKLNVADDMSMGKTSKTMSNTMDGDGHYLRSKTGKTKQAKSDISMPS
eukprot:scaffold354040_cov83-Cyclotella_meneghiniana.AAC.3